MHILCAVLPCDVQKEKSMRSAGFWLWVFILFGGLVLGGFLGDVLGGYSALSWLSYGKEFGLTEPMVLDCYIFKLTFAFMMRINIASIIGVLLAILLYRLFRK